MIQAAQGGALFSYYEPRSSLPGGIKQALSGLGFFQSGAHELRVTEVDASTLKQVTQTWPLTNGLLAQQWVARGVPAIYAPPIEPPEMVEPEFLGRAQFEKVEYDSWGAPGRSGDEPLVYQRTRFEERTVVDPLFVRAKFDQRVTSERALNRYMVLTNDVYPGGLYQRGANIAMGTSEPFYARSRQRNDALTDVFDLNDRIRRKPRWGTHQELDNWRTVTAQPASTTAEWQLRRDRHNAGKLELRNYHPAYGSRQNFTKHHYMPRTGERDRGF